MIGMGGDRVLPSLTGLEDDSRKGRKILARRGEIFRDQLLPSLRAFPGARALLQRISGDGMRIVTASSASVEDLNALLKQAGLHDLIDASASSDDAKSSKPSPDIIEAALTRAGCTAAEAVMIGDTPYDVKAALRADVACIGFRCGGWNDAALHGAAEIYDGPAELLERYDGSLLARARQPGE
jgi:HAD superfamily hydrolase (TIGR01509 family)